MDGLPDGVSETGTTGAVTFSIVALALGETVGATGGRVGGGLGTTIPSPGLPPGVVITVMVGAGVVGASLLGASDGDSDTFSTEDNPVPAGVGKAVTPLPFIYRLVVHSPAISLHSVGANPRAFLF